MRTCSGKEDHRFCSFSLLHAHHPVHRVNPFGMYFGHIRASDLILVDHEGKIVRGNTTVNKAAFMIHGAIHQARPDVICAVHT